MSKTLTAALIQAAKTDKGLFFVNGPSQEDFVTYSEFLEDAKKYLALFQKQGVQQGEELVLQFDSLQGFLKAYWACLLGGIVPVPLAYGEIADNAHKVLKVWPVLSSPWMASDTNEIFSKLEQHAQLLDDVEEAVVLIKDKMAPRSFVADEVELKSSNKISAKKAKLAEVSPRDIAFIQFSSGSTGSPKGVTLTHENLLVNIADILISVDRKEEDVFLSWKPKSHDFGMIGFHLAPLVGCLNQVHIPTKLYIWSPSIWFQAVDKHRASVLGSPNFGYQHFLKLYKRRRKEAWDWDLSCVKTIINGAEPVSADLCKRFTDEMAQYNMPAEAIRVAYGLAEASLIVSMCGFNEDIIKYSVDREQLNMGDEIVRLGANDENAVTLVDCGIPYSSTKVRITDVRGNEMPEGKVGRIEIRGGNVTAGYYNNPEATQAAVSQDGWVDTGDLGFKVEGRLVFASRVKEMIIINGVNYFPYDIERAILRVKGEAALNQFIACSIPHPDQQGEELAIFVYYKKDAEDFLPIVQEIKDIILNSFGVEVNYVVPTDKIPKTTSGKVQRFRLCQKLMHGEFDEALNATGQTRSVSSQDNSRGGQASFSESSDEKNKITNKRESIKNRIRELVMEEAKIEELADDKSFFALGIPSIRLIAIQMQIEEEFNAELSSVAALDNASVEQLAECIFNASDSSKESSVQNQSESKKSAAVKSNPLDDIAIVGLGCRFPGGANSPQEFWSVLSQGIDPVGPIPAERWARDPQRSLPVSTVEGGFLKDIELFDPSFFGITPMEAEAMDPQQRLLLEVCHEALENSGCNVAELKGSNTGVFVGISTAEYAQIARDLGHETGPYSSTGNMFNTASGRISHVFGLQGPSIAIDSACSSSLVCVHQASQALKTGSCDMVVVAAVNLILKPDGHISYSKLDALSPSGRCRSFDDGADGYIRSEGCGAVVLKRLSDAERDGDNVLAVIRGSHVNHNGHNGGLTVPSAQAQENVIRSALHQANIAPEDIDYLEAHGSGTKLGDPQEASALSRVFFGRQTPLNVGSVKSNLGHLEAAAGMAGLIKVILSLKNKSIPGNLHFGAPNSLIDWSTTPLNIVDRLTPWPAKKGVRTGSITSLGINGSNVHLVLQAMENDSADIVPSAKQPALPAPCLFTLSAKSQAGLVDGLEAVANALPETADHQEFYRWSRASQFQRSHYSARYACLAADMADLKRKLEKTVEKRRAGSLSGLSSEPQKIDGNQVVFLFTGQGSVYPGIAQGLYAQSAVFKNAFDRCVGLFASNLNASLLDAVRSSDEDAKHLLEDTAFTQALIFSVEYALYENWTALGLKPGAVIGHSIGEYAAAVAAGAIELEHAVEIVSLRGTLMKTSTAKGKMAGILASKEQVEDLCKDIPNVWIAAVNSPENVTVSGDSDAVEQVLQAAKKARIFTESIAVGHAFHSPMMMDSAAEFKQRLSAILSKTAQGALHTKLYSTMSAEPVVTADNLNAEYWSQHLCRPVLFANALQQAVKNGARYFIEIGGNATLTGLAAEMVANQDAVFVPTLREGKDAWQQLSESLAHLYKAGFNLNWTAYHGDKPALLDTFPNTAYHRERYWFKPLTAAAQAPVQAIHAAVQNSSNVMQISEATNPQILDQADPLSESEVSLVILNMLSEVCGIDESELSDDTHLLSLGLDSLMLVQLGRRIESKYKVDIALKDLFKSLHTPSLIAAHILDRIPEAKRAELLAEQSHESVTAAPVAPTVSAAPAAGLQNAVPDNSVAAPMAQHSAAIANATGNSGVLELMKSQLDVMQQQIQLLAGQPAQAIQNQTPQVPAPQQVAQTSVPATQNASQAPQVQKYQAEFTALDAIDWPQENLTAQQKAFIQALTTELNTRAIGSKTYAADHGSHFTDWLVRAHFMPETREMGYLVVAETAKGCKFKDVDGNEYIDTCLGFTVNLFGHSPDFVTKAISEQLSKGMILGPQSDKAGEVAQMISELTGVERVAFTNSGTEAVMAALRVARAVSGRKKVARFSVSYHGTFDGVLAQATEHGTAPLAKGVLPSMVEDTLVLNYASEKSLEEIRAHAGELAAVLVEPVQSRSLAQPIEYLRKLRALTEELGVALIFDEIIFGFRCHPGGVQQRFGISADLVTYGKVVGGGMPLGVVAGKAKYMDGIDGGDWTSPTRKERMPHLQTTFFAGTFCKHPLAMAAAHAVLTHLKKDGGALQKRLDNVTEAFVDQVNDFFAEEQVPFKMKSFSSVYRFDPLPSEEPEKLGLESDLFFRLMLKKGIYVCYVWENRSGSFSAAHTPDDVQAIIAAIKYATYELRKGGFSFRALSLPTPPPKKAKSSISEPVSTLSSDERRMFVLSQMPGGDLAYRICGALKIQGEFDLNKAQQALKQLSSHHRALRTCFRVESGEVKRIVEPNIEPLLVVESLEGRSEAEAITPAADAFDLSRAPLWRTRVVESSHGGQPEHLMLLEFSHAIFDGISISKFIQDFLAAYCGESLNPVQAEFERQVAKEIAFNQSEEAAEQLAYWKSQLTPVPAALNLPADRPRPAQASFEGAMHSFVLESDLVAAVRGTSKNLRCTPFTLLFGAFFILLGKLAKQQDVCIGLPADSRSQDCENTLGMFARTLAIRGDLAPQSSFKSFIEQLGEHCANAYANSDTPFDQLVEALEIPRDISRNALFDTMFIYELGDERSAQKGGLSVSPLPLEIKASAFDLTLELTLEKGELFGRMIYSTNLFDASTVASWQGYYEHILKQVLEAPELTLEQVQLLAPADKERLLETFNDTRRDYPLESTLVDLVTNSVVRSPEVVALHTASGSLSYADLDKRANQVAAHLLSIGAAKGQYIGVMLPRGQDLIVALLAVLKTGAAYVPMDPEYPKAQLEYMLEKSAADILLSYPELCDALQAGQQIVDPRTVNSANNQDVAAINHSAYDQPAYTIFTSGSTGKPKGVVVGHRSLVNFVLGLGEVSDFPSKATTLGLTSVSFDIFVLEVFLTFARGGTLVLADEQDQRDPHRLVSLMKEQHVNVVQMTPSRLQLILSVIPMEQAFEGVERLLIGGEAFPAQHAQGLAQIPGLRLFNVYGPTETTVWSAVAELKVGDEVTLGKPIANTRCYVLDEDRQLLPEGSKGDLYIAGEGLALGYLNDAERTAQVFVPDPFVAGELMYRTGDIAAWKPDGRLAYFGRSDNQIKLFGYRIELGGIEASLLKCRGVENAAVVVRELVGKPVLTAFCQCTEGFAELASDELTADIQLQLKEKLPEYMIPGVVIHLAEMPLTPNSKIDRKQLPQDITRFVDVTPDLTETEEDSSSDDELMLALRKIWKELLGDRPLATKRSFFELGGNSMSLVLMHSAIDQIHPGVVDVSDIFANPSLSALHQLISARLGNIEEDAEFVELVLPEDYFMPMGSISSGENSLRLNWDETAKSNIRNYAEKHGVTAYDVVLAMHGLLLHKILQKDEITVYSACEQGYSGIALNFANVADTGELVRHVQQVRASATAQKASPRLDRQNNNGILTLFVEGQPAKTQHRGFDIVFNINSEGAAERLDFDSSRLCGQKMTDLASGTVKLVKAAVAEA